VSFREKTLWVSFVLLFTLFGVYFWHVTQVGHGNADPNSTFHIFLLVLITLIVAELAVRLVLRIRNPKEARAARDERERAIELRARSIAYYVMLAGALLTVGSVHISTDGYFLAQHILLALVVAELTRLGAQIVIFRREAA